MTLRMKCKCDSPEMKLFHLTVNGFWRRVMGLCRVHIGVSTRWGHHTAVVTFQTLFLAAFGARLRHSGFILHLTGSAVIQTWQTNSEVWKWLLKIYFMPKNRFSNQSRLSLGMNLHSLTSGIFLTPVWIEGEYQKSERLSFFLEFWFFSLRFFLEFLKILTLRNVFSWSLKNKSKHL